MKVNLFSNPSMPFYLFVLGFIIVIASPTLFSEGMFMDGLIYSTIAHNLSNGIGSFWNPHFTSTCLPEFHEHPPLAFGIQSIFFFLFGESRYIDKLYSILTFIVVGFIILKIWKHFDKTYGWLPLAMWLITPLVFWSFSNNMLENTLTIFTSLSVLFYLKSQNSNKYLYVFLSGFALSLGFLTKGFVAFFPWTFPFLIWATMKQKPFIKVVVDTFVLLFATVIPLLVLITISPTAKLSLNYYFEMQVVNSLKNVITVDSRFYIIERLFLELIPSFILIILFLIFGWRRKLSLSFKKNDFKKSTLFVLLGLAGVLPIMISLKQSGFYILTTFPFFAIGLSFLIYPLIDSLMKNINSKSKRFIVFKWFSYAIFVFGCLLSIYFSTQFGRDKNKIKDTCIIASILADGSIINIDPNMWPDWSLHGYFMRYKNVSLDPYLTNTREYLLIRNEYYSDTLEVNYKIIKLKTTEYKLLKRINFK